MRNFIICLLASFAWMTSTGQYMWQGQAGNRRVLISVERDSCGGRTACFTLPENWITRAQADRLSISGDSLSASCQNNGIRIDGTFSGGGAVLDATVVVYRDTMRMAMKRTDRLLDLYYPHNPRPPYPYTTEEVSYFSQDDSIRFAATLTLPEGEGPFPAAIIVSGTGKQDRDGSFSGHRPFHRIADYLTRRGYAILRTDDRGTGGTSTRRPEPRPE